MGKTLKLKNGDKLRTGVEYIAEIPKEYGPIVSTCIFKDQYYVACSFGILKLNGDKLEPFIIVPQPGEKLC